MAKTAKGKPAFASLNPGDMLQGGLPTDFRGVVTGAKYHKFDYNGTAETPVLAVELTIHPHEDSEMAEDIVQSWSAGDLRSWVPGDEDGDAAEEGPYAVGIGKRPQMNSNTNFAHLMQTILESGAAKKKFTEKNLTNNIDCLIGLDAHWDRVPQKKRKGMADRLTEDAEGGEGEDAPKPKARNNDILVVTEVFGYDPDGAAEAPVAKKKQPVAKPVVEDDDEDEDEEEAPVAKKSKKPAPVEDEDEDEDESDTGADEAADDDDDEEEVNPLDAELSKAIKSAIKTAGGSLKKGKVAAIVLKAFAADKRKNKLVSRSAEEEFLSGKGRPWEFDEDTGVLSIG